MNSDNNNFRDKYYDDDVNEDIEPVYHSESSHGSAYSKNNINTEKNYADIQKYEKYAMERRTAAQTPKKPKRRLRKFFFRLLAVLLAVVLIFFAVSWVMSLFVPQKTNILIMATDEDGTRTDTLMIGTFDKSTKKITIVSIPP